MASTGSQWDRAFRCHGFVEEREGRDRSCCDSSSAFERCSQVFRGARQSLGWRSRRRLFLQWPAFNRATPHKAKVVERRNVEFEAEGGVKLRGWLFVPSSGPGPYPAVTMAHGYAGIKEQGIEPFAKTFAEGGFVVLLHDHRGFGASHGQPRQDVDPWRQIDDWRRAISYLEKIGR